jgi:hypothetical protein
MHLFTGSPDVIDSSGNDADLGEGRADVDHRGTGTDRHDAA